MKKGFFAIGLFVFMSCSNNSGESGVQDDGFKGAGDPNGGLSDTQKNYTPRTDSALGEDRVDTWKRDSASKTTPKH